MLTTKNTLIVNRNGNATLEKCLSTAEHKDRIDFYCSSCKIVIGRYLKKYNPTSDLLYYYNFWNPTACRCGECHNLHLDHDLDDIVKLYYSQLSPDLGNPNLCSSDFIRYSTICEKYHFGLNGTGEITREHLCGEIIWSGVCENDDLVRELGEDVNSKHTRKFKLSLCYQATCPKCSDQWVNRETESSIDRLTATKELYNLYNHPRHTIVSPPQDRAIEILLNDGIQKLWAWFHDVRKEYIKSDFGGCGVLHLFRIDERGRAAFRRYRWEGGDIDRIWKWVRANEYSEFVYLSPHFHIFVYGTLPKSNHFYNQTGWFYKTKNFTSWVLHQPLSKLREVAANQHLKNYEHLNRARLIKLLCERYIKNAIKYALSHAGLKMVEDKDGRLTHHEGQVMHWFGISSYNKVCNAPGYPIKERVEVLCSKCGGTLWKWSCEEHGIPLSVWSGHYGDPEPVMKTIITRKYILKSDKKRKFLTVKVDDYG